MFLLATPGMTDAAFFKGPERVLQAIVGSTAITAARIAEVVDIVNSVAIRHLQLLEEKGHVTSRVVGKERHYFLRFTDWEQEFLGLLWKQEAVKLLQTVASRPSLDVQPELALKAGISMTAFRNHVEAFVKLGLVASTTIPAGRTPGLGHEVKWREAEPTLRLLLAKLPASDPAAAKIRDVLQRKPPLA